MDVSEKALKSLATRLASQIEERLANNTDFLQRIADNLALSESKADARPIADSTSSGYDASAETDDSNAYTPPPFEGYQRIEEKTTKKVVTFYGSEKVVCPTCDKTVTARNLREHMNMHLMYPRRPHRCEICEVFFAYKRDFERHMRRKHQNCPSD